MDKTEFSQGEDIECEVTLKQPDGTPIDLSYLGTKVYAIIHDGYNTIVAKYKTGSSATGYKIIDPTDLATGEIKFRILSDVTNILKPGKYYIEVQARFYDPDSTDDGYKDLIEKEEFFIIRKSNISTLTLPA